MVRMRVVIVANGLIADSQVEMDRWVRVGDVVAAADGGTQHLLRCRIYPHHVIGDLDSLDPDVQADLAAHGTVFHPHPAHKDETDLELALLWAADTYPDAGIVVLGAMGGRPDLALANLLLLALPQLVGQAVMIADQDWTVCLLRDSACREFRGAPGDTLSLIPLGGPANGVTTTGLAYPLDGESLAFGPARGVSNMFLAEKAGVCVESGMVWVFQERKT
ncbi:MAG: thiamine diphosphokinase [Anaerolineae bacterium]|nr:thiamine diphosphokinase [Anaerolineae bacterium]